MVVIVNGGYFVNLYFISKVLDENGIELWKVNFVWVCEVCIKGVVFDNMLDENEEVDIEVFFEVQLN